MPIAEPAMQLQRSAKMGSKYAEMKIYRGRNTVIPTMILQYSTVKWSFVTLP